MLSSSCGSVTEVVGSEVTSIVVVGSAVGVEAVVVVADDPAVILTRATLDLESLDHR